jgi:hypothetical protein
MRVMAFGSIAFVSLHMLLEVVHTHTFGTHKQKGDRHGDRNRDRNRQHPRPELEQQ